mgnify:FL=1
MTFSYNACQAHGKSFDTFCVEHGIQVIDSWERAGNIGFTVIRKGDLYQASGYQAVTGNFTFTLTIPKGE